MTYIYSDPSREAEPTAPPNIEVFYNTWREGNTFRDENGALMPEGWYWWPCFPGCLPDGEPNGPFETEELAVKDAQDND